MSSSDQQVQLLFGDMEVSPDELGPGGMGKVQLARSRSTRERFAVKRTRLSDWSAQRNFLVELMTWYGLPRHPHIVECRFFRTLHNDENGESEIAIFAEYMSGGSLADWIRDRKFTRLKQILDVAIQFAWGLHAAHELGVVHQDVKPGNVLLLPSGSLTSVAGDSGEVLVKVGDFGLARARAMSGALPEGQTNRDSAECKLVTRLGMTLGYCSPEQLACERLSHKTDIWSWGKSILDVFRGELNERGTKAPQILQEYLKTRPGDPRLPLMPDGMVEILGKCFREDPAERWTTMAEVADVLRDVYRQTLRQEYPRSAPSAFEGNNVVEHDRRTACGAQWRNPRHWLVPVLQTAGKDPADAESLLVRAISRKAQPIADLVGYEEVLQRVKDKGPLDQITLAQLCAEKALIHEHVNDAPGAFVLFDRATDIYEHLVQQEMRHELANDLASTLQNKAVMLQNIGCLREALELFDRAIAIRERLEQMEGRHDLAHDLARTYGNKAATLVDLGDLRTSVAYYDRAIAIFDRLVEHNGRHELERDLALTYQNKANALGELGDVRGAMALYNRAIAIYESLVQQFGRQELADELAGAYQNKANVLVGLGEIRHAVSLYNQAIEIRERLVTQEGRHELAKVWAGTYSNKAIALARLCDFPGAVKHYDLAIAIYERLVRQEGRYELDEYLAATFGRKAGALADAGDQPGALPLYDHAITIYERLVWQDGRQELANELAATYQDKANALGDLGDHHGAVALYDRAIVDYERIVSQDGRQELANELAATYQNKATALGDLGDTRGALELYDRAIAVYERLVRHDGRHELASYMAVAYKNKGNELADFGDLRAAVALYDQAIAIYEQMVEKVGRQELLGDLGQVKVVRATALMELGERQRARIDAREAVAILHAESVRTKRTDLQVILDSALKNLRELL